MIDLLFKEFLFGKMGGVFYVVCEMVFLLFLFLIYLWWNDGILIERLFFFFVGLGVMYIFVVIFGIYCGMIYSNLC